MNKLQHSLQRWYQTHWQWLRDFFEIAIFQYLAAILAIIAMVAKIVADNQPKGQKFDFNAWFSNSQWTLLSLSASMFIAAFILYHLFCPRFIKVYPNFGEYKKYLHSPRWIVREAQNAIKSKKALKKFTGRMKTKQYLLPDNRPLQKKPSVQIEKDATVLYIPISGRMFKIAMPVLHNGAFDKEKTDVAENEIFWEVFELYSSSRTWVRLLIYALLLLSAILFLWVLINNISSIVRLLFSKD